MFQKGDQIGYYSLLQKLGKGAFGEVWLAEEKTAISSHKFALKLPNESDVDLEAIRQEADVWEQVKGHPNILPIIKADIYKGQIYIASEYAPDGSLSEWLKLHGGKAPTIELAVEMTKGILAGLQHLHSKGVIHRDLKPANILLQAHTPRIADFGIARLAKSAATANSTLSAGTPSYMAPECFYSVRSEQTDLWAVGVLFHKLLSGKLPFAHPDQVSVMNAILNGEPEIDPEIPENLRQIINKALQKDTALRYQSASEMRADLDKFIPVDIADEDTLAEPVVPVKQSFEREEETIVRPKPEAVYIHPVEYHSSNNNKTLAIGLASFLVLAAVTVWAALQLGGDDTQNQPAFSDYSNQTTSNSSLNNRNSGLGNQTTFVPLSNQRINVSNSSMISNIENPIPSSDTNLPGESNTSENPSATPFDIQPDDPSPNVNDKPRQRRVETPATEGEKTPAPSNSPAPTPIEVAPIPPPAVTPRRRDTKPTPRPGAQPDETPPLPKTSESNMNFRDF